MQTIVTMQALVNLGMELELERRARDIATTVAQHLSATTADEITVEDIQVTCATLEFDETLTDRILMEMLRSDGDAQDRFYAAVRETWVRSFGATTT